MTRRITTLAIAALALIGAETAAQHISAQSLFGAEAAAQANHNTTRSNRKRSGVAAPADTVDDGCDSLPNPARCDKSGEASDGNTYGSTRSNKEGIAAPAGTGVGDGTSPIITANTNTSRSNKKEQVAGDNEHELIGHIALVRIGAPTGGDSWCEPFDCATFEDAQVFYRDNPTLELPKFLERRRAER